MNCITTLVDLRNKIFKEYNRVNDEGDSYMEAEGLFAALNIVENTLEKEIDARDKYAEAQ